MSNTTPLSSEAGKSNEEIARELAKNILTVGDGSHGDAYIGDKLAWVAIKEALDAKDAKIATARAEVAAFKNFHKNLCVRFGYGHDEAEWKRDQASLEEHIANQISELQGEVSRQSSLLLEAEEALEKIQDNKGLLPDGYEQSLYECQAIASEALSRLRGKEDK